MRRKHKNTMTILPAYFSAQPLAPQAARWIRMSLRLLGLIAWLLFALLCLTATGCRATEAAPPPTATVIPFPTFTATPVERPTMTPATIAQSTPAAPQSVSLPAALYLLTSDGQVARLDADGSTITLLTTEPEPIVAFDVSPTDGRLAYHVGAALFEILPDGTRIRKADTTDYWKNRPRFSPDGAEIYVYQPGVGLQRIPVGVDAVAALVLAEATPTVTESDGVERRSIPIQHYPWDWSPDGRYLVLLACDTHCGLFELFDLQTQRLIPLTLNDPVDQMEVSPTGQWSWPPQAASPLMTTNGLMGPRSAVMRADPLTGDVTVLFKQLTIGATTYELPHMLSTWPVDDETFFVVGAPAIGAQTHLYRVDQQGIATPLMAVGGAFSHGGEVLWANDGSGLVYSAQGVMEWLPTDGNPPFRLPISGTALQWGP